MCSRADFADSEFAHREELPFLPADTTDEKWGLVPKRASTKEKNAVFHNLEKRVRAHHLRKNNNNQSGSKSIEDGDMNGDNQL